MLGWTQQTGDTAAWVQNPSPSLAAGMTPERGSGAVCYSPLLSLWGLEARVPPSLTQVLPECPTRPGGVSRTLIDLGLAHGVWGAADFLASLPSLLPCFVRASLATGWG